MPGKYLEKKKLKKIHKIKLRYTEIRQTLHLIITKHVFHQGADICILRALLHDRVPIRDPAWSTNCSLLLFWRVCALVEKSLITLNGYIWFIASAWVRCCCAAPLTLVRGSGVRQDTFKQEEKHAVFPSGAHRWVRHKRALNYTVAQSPEYIHEMKSWWGFHTERGENSFPISRVGKSRLNPQDLSSSSSSSSVGHPGFPWQDADRQTDDLNDSRPPQKIK